MVETLKAAAEYAALAVPVALQAPGRDPRPSTTAHRLAPHSAEARPSEGTWTDCCSYCSIGFGPAYWVRSPSSNRTRSCAGTVEASEPYGGGSRDASLGRPGIAKDLRDLIREISGANPLWGAPRVHGELLKLGIDVAQSTVAKYMSRARRPPSQSWRTFLHNHAGAIASIDLFVVPTIALRMLFGFVVLHHGRRQLVHVGVTAHPTAEWLSHQFPMLFPGTRHFAILFEIVTAPLARSSHGCTPWESGSTNRTAFAVAERLC